MARQTKALGELSVLDRTGAHVPLSTLWKDQTVVLAFVRHFG